MRFVRETVLSAKRRFKMYSWAQLDYHEATKKKEESTAQKKAKH